MCAPALAACLLPRPAAAAADLRLPTAALEEELASGKRDNFLTLNAVKVLFSHHPGVYGDGQGQDVAPFLLILVPALAEPHLRAAHAQILAIIDEFCVLIAHRFRV